MSKRFLQVLKNEKIRSKVEKQRGQLVLLEDFEKLLKSVASDRADSTISNAVQAAKKKATELEARFIRTKIGKKRLNTLKERRQESKSISKFLDSSNIFTWEGGNANTFLVSNFYSSVNAIKNAALTVLFPRSEDRKNAAAALIQKGHGETGLAVSQIQLSSYAQKVSSSTGEDVETILKNFQAYITQISVEDDPNETGELFKRIKSIEDEWYHLVTLKGDIRATYFSKISFQSTEDNQNDKIYEQRLVKLFRKFVEKEYAIELHNKKSSPSLKEKIEESLILNVTLPLGKSVKVVRKKKPVKLGADRSKSKVSKKPEALNLLIRGTAPRAVPKSKAARKTKTSNINLIALINESLPETVAKNMNLPRLKLRTGRFASSVKATDVTTTPQGFLSIGYTYMKAPYQTFEPGFKQGSVERDPRKLIDFSIREIATGLITQRFYTRRV